MSDRRSSCDVCGGDGGRALTAEDRRVWPSVAAWVRAACPDCRQRFARNAERVKTKAAA